MSSTPIELKHISNQDAVYDPNSTENGNSDYDDIPLSKHRRLKWKIDLYMLPLISSVYFFASMACWILVFSKIIKHIRWPVAYETTPFQGRSDLANAKIAGLSEELRLSPQDYSNAATMFLVAYVIAQLPGTLLLKKIGPPRQFAGAMITVRYKWIFIRINSYLISYLVGHIYYGYCCHSQ